jgi:hypothetical protein
VDEDSDYHNAPHYIRHFHAVTRRRPIEPKEEELVDPIGSDVLEHADEIEQRHPRRVYHDDEECCEYLRVSNLNEELWAGVKLLIVLLEELFRLFVVQGAASITAPYKRSDELPNKSSDVRSCYVDEHREADCRANNSVPLDREIRVLSLEEGYKVRKLYLLDTSIDQQNNKTLVSITKTSLTVLMN